MYLWIVIAILWVIYFVLLPPLGVHRRWTHAEIQSLWSAMVFGFPAFFLTGFAILRACLRWVGRQFRGAYKKS